MMRLAAVVLVAGLVTASHADPLPSTPVTQDPIGPIVDVTASWQAYQPATDECVRPDVFQFAGPGPTVTGADPVCAASGFAASDTGLVKIHVVSPDLCAGCRRLFFDYTKIPAVNESPVHYAHGHIYFGLASFNRYTVEPHAHSPNIKNFTNDKLFVPDGSAQEPLVALFDTYTMAYTGNTKHFVHVDVQGPYYAGRWYLSRGGVRIAGSYLDVSPSAGGLLPDPRLNAIGYAAVFHSGERICPDELYDQSFADGDGYYGGCVDGFGVSANPINPFG